jgi:zinc/manganese transport system permease protein
MSIFEIMAAPFAECMVLVAIHTYLGIHVLKRRVIFVDLALAQTAALGTTMGFVFGILPDSGASLVFSIVFASIGAAIFALTRMRSDVIPQEAIIGFFYAVCAALAILVIQKTSGVEHIDDILVGSILWVGWSDVGVAALAYSVVGVVHFVFRKQFMLISESPEKAYDSGLNVKFWDFLFYLTFGFVISFSVRVAGVLLVFVFLVGPAIMALLLTKRLRYQLLIGWATGTLVTVLGLTISYVGDLPGGPAVIAFYGVVLLVQGVIYYIVKSPDKMNSLRNVFIGLVATGAVSGGIYFLGNQLAPAENTGHTHMAETEIRNAEDKAEEAKLKEKALEKQFQSLDPWVVNNVSEKHLRAYVSCSDALEKMNVIQSLPAASIERAVLAISFLSDVDIPLFFKNQALEIIESYSHRDFEVDVETGLNQGVIEDMKRVVLSSDHS